MHVHDDTLRPHRSQSGGSSTTTLAERRETEAPQAPATPAPSVRAGRRWPPRWIWVAAAALAVVLAAAGSAPWWLAPARSWIAERTEHLAFLGPAGEHEEEAGAHEHGEEEGEEAHDEHEEGAAAEAGHAEHADEDLEEAAPGHRHDEADALALSRQAQANIGLQFSRVELRPFERTITVPGMIVERPGWSRVEVTASTTGVVTKVEIVEGQSLKPGQALFELRLTHEDLLQAQTEFLRTVEELDVIGREVARLQQVTAQGAIAGKTLLERQYEQQRQQGLLRSQRQALLLHGLTEAQVDGIAQSRTLVQTLTFAVPVRGEETAAETLQVEQLHVSQGSAVNVGDKLCTLVNYSELFVEGQAFEQDVAAISLAAANGWTVTTGLEGGGSCAIAAGGTKIRYFKNTVDADSRTFRFYVPLCNHILREDEAPDGRRFVYWQFKPGQRTEVKVPVEQWPDRIVLPVEAVAQEGAESYVFEFNDDHFDRRPINVEYRDQQWAVIANDGTLRIGSQVASSAAHQMQMAMKNKAGGAVDPHAGHNH